MASRGVLDPASFASGTGANVFVQVVNCLQSYPFPPVVGRNTCQASIKPQSVHMILGQLRDNYRFGRS